MRKEQQQADEAGRELLKDYFSDPPEDKKEARKYFTVYTRLKHVSASGMMRVIDCYIIRDNEPLRISWSVAKAAGYTYDRKYEGVKVGGCGMDMGFSIVNNLSICLFCPNNYDHDQAYKLQHQWL
jgi:hypothetical protein